MNLQMLEDAAADPSCDPVPVLLKGLNAPDEAVRATAARLLGEMPTERSVPPLCRLLRHDPHDWVRWEAAEALGLIGHVSAVDSLLASVTDPDDGVRLCVAESLGLVGAGDARVAPALCCLLTDLSESVRLFALEALGDLGDPIALPAVQTRRNAETPAARVWVYYALATLGDEPFALIETLTVLRRGGRLARTQAAKVLWRMATPQTTPRILRALERAWARETSPGMRECLERYVAEVRAEFPAAGRAIDSSSGR